MAERLQKYLARAGVASRRAAEELITAGRVQVNNSKVTELGSRVEPGDLVTVDGKLVTPPEEKSYYILYKPTGVVTTLDDPQGRPTVAEYVGNLGRRLFPVGRLDYDAEGALLFTDDGELANRLTHPRFEVPRTYLAKVKGTPDAPTLDKLRGGVRLEDGMATPLEVEVREQAERNTWLKLVVAEGRPHLIKRLCAAVGHPVVRLFRPNYAGVGVAGMQPGEVRPLKEAEVQLLQAVSEGKAEAPTAELSLPPRRHGRGVPGAMGEEGEAPRRAPRAAAARPPRAGGRPSTRAGEREERPRAGRGGFRGEETGARAARAFGARPSRGAGAGERAERTFGARPSRGAGERGERTFGARPSRGAGERGERTFGARPSRGAGERGERTFGARPSRGAGPGEREPRAFGARPARGAGFGGREERPARGGGFGGREERPARRAGFGGREERPARGAGFGGREERPARRAGFGGREERPARRTGFGEREARPARGAGFGSREDRPARRTGFGEREARPFTGRAGPRREEGAARTGRTFGGRPAARGEEGGARRFSRRPMEGGEGFGGRPARPSGARPERPAAGGRFGARSEEAGARGPRTFEARAGRPAGRAAPGGRPERRGEDFAPRGGRSFGARPGPGAGRSAGPRGEGARSEGGRTDWRGKKAGSPEPRRTTGRPSAGPRKGPPRRG